MKKLTLNVDALEVDSFLAAEAVERGGTVHGAAIATSLCPRTFVWSCGIVCPQTFDPAITGPCRC